jgi:DNA-binding transcriptional MerR regulator
MIEQLRGPFTINELAALSGVSVRTIRRYQKQGIIPRRREWAEGKIAKMFYKIDIDRIRKKQSIGRVMTGL